MVSDRAVYQFLPPGGRLNRELSAIGDVADAGGSHETSSLAAGVGTADNAEVIVEQDVCVLECSEGDHLDGWLAQVIGQDCRELATRGDGACAMHAAFGKADATRHELRCEHPRRLLRALLGESLEVIRKRVRPAQLELLDTVVSSLWTDFVVPYVGDEKKEPPNEEAMFLELLQSSPLWASVLDRVQVNRALAQQADEMKATCGTQSAAMFQPGLDKPLWSFLAIGAGLRPPERLSGDSEHEAQSVPHARDL